MKIIENKVFRLRSDYQFIAKDIDDANKKLSEHFGDLINSKLEFVGGWFLLDTNNNPPPSPYPTDIQ